MYCPQSTNLPISHLPMVRSPYSPPVIEDAEAGVALRDFEAFLRQDVVADTAGVNRQAVVVQHAPKLRHAFG